MFSLHDIPGNHDRQVTTIAHAAATATEIVASVVAPFAAKMTVYWVPNAAITGTATNYTNLNVINKGQAGAGTTELGNVDFASGTDATACDELALVATAVAVAAGDVIALQAEKVSTGLAIPAGTLVARFKGA